MWLHLYLDYKNSVSDIHEGPCVAHLQFDQVCSQIISLEQHVTWNS